MYVCEFCGEQLDPFEPGTYRKVVGWVQQRKAGGAHAVHDPSAPLAYAHAHCIEMKKKGINPGQGSML